MSATLTKTTSEFVGVPKRILLSSIRPSIRNPRGSVERNESFERLVSSISKVDILVPLVVRELPNPEGDVKYELVDGERRYHAATECGLDRVPAHIIHTGGGYAGVRKLMFHLHMTREQWLPLAQCKALAEAYPELEEGIRFAQKPEWIRRLTTDIVMDKRTASDRVHMLCWPKRLKQEIYDYDSKGRKSDIYSYVVAIEINIIEPSRVAFSNYYNHGRPPETTANEVRESVFHKTTQGLDAGTVTSREQIRSVAPLFARGLDASKKKIAEAMFREFVKRTDFQFDDLRAEIGAKLPEALQENPPKPKRVIASMRSLERTLRSYNPSYLDDVEVRPATKKRLKDEFVTALDELASAIELLRDQFE